MFVVKDMYEIPRGCIPSYVERSFSGQLALGRSEREGAEPERLHTKRVRGPVRVIFTFSKYSPSPMRIAAHPASGLANI